MWWYRFTIWNNCEFHILARVRSICIWNSVDPRHPELHAVKGLYQERTEMWEKAREAFKKDIISLKERLEKEFRSLLGVENWLPITGSKVTPVRPYWPFCPLIAGDLNDWSSSRDLSEWAWNQPFVKHKEAPLPSRIVITVSLAGGCVIRAYCQLIIKFIVMSILV